MQHPFPPGTRVHHIGEEWAVHVPGGTAEIIRAVGPCHRGDYEYEVRTGRDFSRRPGPDNPMDRITWWASYATVPARPKGGA